MDGIGALTMEATSFLAMRGYVKGESQKDTADSVLKRPDNLPSAVLSARQKQLFDKVLTPLLTLSLNCSFRIGKFNKTCFLKS